MAEVGEEVADVVRPWTKMKQRGADSARRRPDPGEAPPDPARRRPDPGAAAPEKDLISVDEDGGVDDGNGDHGQRHCSPKGRCSGSLCMSMA